MEILVDKYLPELIKEEAHIMECEKCQEDIKAIALNHLKPMYVVTEKGSVYAKVREFSLQFQSDVTQELVKGIDLVSKRPQHNGEE